LQKPLSLVSDTSPSGVSSSAWTFGLPHLPWPSVGNPKTRFTSPVLPRLVIVPRWNLHLFHTALGWSHLINTGCPNPCWVPHVGCDLTKRPASKSFGWGTVAPVRCSWSKQINRFSFEIPGHKHGFTFPVFFLLCVVTTRLQRYPETKFASYGVLG